MELVSLTWRDIDFKGEEIRLTNFKSFDDPRNKYRRIPMHPELRKILERKKAAKEKVPFTAPGSHNTIRRWLIDAAKAAGLKGVAGVHDLRHTCGAWLARGGASEKYIRDWLGHRDLRSTQIYTHLMPRDLKRITRMLDFL
jgi:type 1 fimbriae regulatory protein FimB/type 1 fimbriae regulatory protein FimE